MSSALPRTLPGEASAAGAAPPAAAANGAFWPRILILLLTVVAFAHVAIGLGHKNLWWDESLSLQRAESPLAALLSGLLLLKDGITQTPTFDQHPFFSFLLQGLLVRTAGSSEYALRFVSALAATLLPAALYALARLYVRQGALPRSAPLWTALLAATSPFLLWYGQEARPYALWAALAVLSTYLLLRSVEPGARRGWLAGYGLVLACFLTTHYYAVFLLPVHAVAVYLALRARGQHVRALAVAGVLLAIGAAIGLAALWMVLAQGGGGNFETINLGVLLPDLINAFSLGLSVNLDQVRWLDLIFALIAVAGAARLLRGPRPRWGWVAIASILTPVVVLYAINLVQPVYMNARHMSLIAGFWMLLVGGGLGSVQEQARWGRWAAPALALLLLGGVAYSSVNYYARDEYRKDDWSGLGAYMEGRIMSGDAVLFYTPAAWRIFDYYTPLPAVRDAIAAGADIALYGVPLLDPHRADTEALLAELGQRHKRIWLLKSGTFPFMDPDNTVETWLRDNFLQVRNAQFYSGSTLRAQLYLPKVPVYDSLPADIQFPADVVFDGAIRLVGYDIDEVAWAADGYGLSLPVTLYWQAAGDKPVRDYKYSLRVVTPTEGAPQTLGARDRLPYEGDIRTTYWDPGKTIAEYVELPADPLPAGGAPLVLTLLMYDEQTLENVPVTSAGGAEVLDGTTVVLPLRPPAAEPQP